MSSRSLSVLALVALLPLATLAAERSLRVCADPDNLPFSRADGTGFENRIAELLAREMGAKLEYAWQPLQRGFVRKTAGAGLCDVFIGVPAGFERVLTTRPYYRSTYVFIARAGRGDPLSFDDARIRTWRVGVQLPGNDLAATPPGYALAARGAIDNVRGFPLFGRTPSAQRIVEAIEAGEIDAGLVWGPPGAWYARQARPHRLDVSPAAPPPGLEGQPFDFAIAVGVKRGDRALRDEIDSILERRRADVDRILADYGVPRVERKERS